MALTSKIQATPYGVEAHIEVATQAEALELAARFPKGTRVHGTRYYPGVGEGVRGSVNFRANLAANDNNGGINEAGLRRLRAYLKACQRLGIETRYVITTSNALTETEFAQLAEGAR